MKPVENVWGKLRIVGFRVSLLFLILLLPFLLIGLFIIRAEENWAFILVLVLAINSLAWFLAGLLGSANNKAFTKKLSHLKAMGNSYEVTIKEMVPVWYVNLGGYISAFARGHYADRYGEMHEVKSITHVFTSFDKKNDFQARIYVDPNNPGSYAIEILKKE